MKTHSYFLGQGSFRRLLRAKCWITSFLKSHLDGGKEDGLDWSCKPESSQRGRSGRADGAMRKGWHDCEPHSGEWSLHSCCAVEPNRSGWLPSGRRSAPKATRKFLSLHQKDLEIPRTPAYH